MEAEYPHHQAGPTSSSTTTLLWPCATRRRKRGEDDDDATDLSPASVAMDLDADAQRVADKLKAVSEEFGHQIRVFSSEKFAQQHNKLPSADHEEDDDFYELQPGDYFNLISNRIAEQSKMLKTRKMREAELAAQRARITKVVMRVRFPDGYILEADFVPSERIHSLVDLLMKVLARPDLPFYLYTVPPKKRILDTSQDFYTAGFVPGANVHFSYDLPEGSLLNTDDLKAGPFLREEILSLDGLSLLLKPASQPDDSRMNSSALQSGVSQSDPAPAPITNKKPGKPKWLKR
ncbi:Plant UBX domain-containing protein 1 [Dichanthelium oligosanthes]|uniref:Plant UBX domain-containing protein 1 n=1 Tax=Dichanthelium oligosanthes TaxID=888268 RepID=A0A1E5V1G0_9POAL|nr:Plant UBX domain-containing protein 1 [Dichanthelium oligosanthes]